MCARHATTKGVGMKFAPWVSKMTMHFVYQLFSKNFSKLSDRTFKNWKYFISPNSKFRPFLFSPCILSLSINLFLRCWLHR